ncbi:peptidase S8/S53 domain-containing protein [Pilobolus umbonatus]|nr:peptidase S8/S53 domain-containing protein [Pilobolus umbonatus]
MVELDGDSFISHDTLIQSLHQEHGKANVVLKRSISHTLFNGFSMEINGEGDKGAILTSVLNKRDVRTVYPVSNMKETHSKRAAPSNGQFNNITETKLMLPHKLTQVDRVHKELNVTGQGVLVGIIDSGFDYMHPALGGGIGPDYKIVLGYDFLGDEESFTEILPDSDPSHSCETELNSHGTYCAAIIAGEDQSTGFVGVAPDAKLAVWKIGNCQEHAEDESIVLSMLMAYDVGVDIISLSFGNDFDNFSLVARIINKLNAAGINVVVAASNSGADGVSTVAEPASAKSAFAIGSVDNKFKPTYILSSDAFNETYVIDPALNTNIQGGRLVVAVPGDTCLPESVYPGIIQGSVVLVNGTDCIEEQIVYLIQNNASEILVYGETFGTFSRQIPIYYIEDTNPEVLLQSDGAKVVVDRLIEKTPWAGLVSDFSSIGPTEYLEFKPNIVAPGGHIYSAVPQEGGSWESASGTSSATPYAAGVLALYKSHRKSMNFDYAEEHLQNYAFAVKANNTKSFDNPIRQGAGLIQAYDALTQLNHISPSQISFNDTVNTAYHTHELTITNNEDMSITYRIYNQVSVSILPYGDNVNKTYIKDTQNTLDIKAEIEFSHNKITIAPGRSKTISVTVFPPACDNDSHAIYGGFIRFSPYFRRGHTSIKPMHVPYIGVLGNQRDVPIFNPVNTLLDVMVNETIHETTDPIVFDQFSSMYLLVPLISPTHILKLEILDAATDEMIGYIEQDFHNMGSIERPILFDGTYLPLIGTTESSESIGPDIYRLPLKPGTYKCRSRGLKYFGDPNNEKDWEVLESVPITIEHYVDFYEV